MRILIVKCSVFFDTEIADVMYATIAPISYHSSSADCCNVFGKFLATFSRVVMQASILGPVLFDGFADVINDSQNHVAF